MPPSARTLTKTQQVPPPAREARGRPGGKGRHPARRAARSTPEPKTTASPATPALPAPATAAEAASGAEDESSGSGAENHAEGRRASLGLAVSLLLLHVVTTSHR